MFPFATLRPAASLLLQLLPLFVLAQSRPPAATCGSDWMLRRARENPELLDRQRRQEDAIYREFSQRTPAAAGRGAALVTLPVVVHIVHDNGAENISDALVQTAIQQLNEAFANTAYYDQGSGTNTMIQFCLAKRTPDGLATSGITRDQHPLTEMSLEADDAALKDLNRWEPLDYINVWLVREICSSGYGCSVAGYATLPSSHGLPHDGIVMEAAYMGSTPGNTGVLVHEMGHYLGLYHTFEGGCINDDCLADGDLVCDTPPDQSTLWTACDLVVNTCNTDAQSGLPSDQPDMILNYMDYTDFNCFNDFTPGQADRMHWHIENVRFSLLESQACLTPCPNPVAAFFNPSAVSIDVGQTISFTNGSTNAASYSWTVNGLPFSSSTDASYTFNTAGTYTVVLTASPADPVFCSPATYQQLVNVSCPVIADFEVNTTTPVIGQTVIVTNQSQNATQYDWFLDGAPQGGSFSGFIPASNGVYAIRLVAGNGFCEKTKIVYLSVQDTCETFTFQKFWGDAADNQGFQTVVLADGNFLVAGTTTVSGHADIYFVKTTPGGATLWQKRLGGTGDEFARRLLALPDGGWLVAGNAGTANTSYPIVARFAADGTTLWQKQMIVPSTANTFTDLALTQDGGLLLAGAIHTGNSANYAAYLTKMSLDGTQSWSTLLDGSHVDWIENVRELPGGELAAAGFTSSFGLNIGSLHDGMVLRFSAGGDLLWATAYGSIDNEWLTDIYPTADGGLMAIGSTSGWNGPVGGTYQDDGWLIKLSAAGTPQWSQVIQSDQNIDFGSRGVCQTAAGSYVFAANDIDGAGSNTPLLFQVDAAGNIEWSHVYPAAGEGLLLDVELAADGYIFTGCSIDGSGDKDVWLLKSDAAGQAGLCPEIPHALTTQPVQPVVTPGGYFILTAPPLVAAAFPLTDLSLDAVTPCAPNCGGDPDCEDTWIRTAGIPNLAEAGNNIIAAADGNFYVTGYRADSTVLLKMTPDGVVLWARSFKFTSGSQERVSQLIEDSEGKLVGCGFFSTIQLNGFTFRYDPDADAVLWARENPPSPQTIYFAVLERSPGGNYLAFNSYHDSPPPGSNDDAAVVEIDRATGEFSGVKSAYNFGGSEGIIEAQLRNGSIYTSGRYTYGYNFGGMRGGISRFDPVGNEIWSRMPFFGVPDQARNYAPDFVFDGDQMVTIHYGDFSGEDLFTDQFAVSKSSLNGQLEWGKVYTIAGSPQIFAKSIVALSDGYAILVANQAIDQAVGIFLVKTDKNGELLWARHFPGLIVERGEKLLAAANGYLYFTAGSGPGDIVLAKVRASDGRVGEACPAPLDAVVSVQALPPVFEAIALVAYDSEISQSPRPAAPHPIALPTTQLCLDVCSPELCNNGLDDDGDGLFDCLDADCNCTACDGQQARFWYFGDGAGLDFSSDPPTLLTDGQTFSREASSVATDILGNLLFYTDAARLYDRNHQLMPNGDGLDGHSSTTQTLILPQPGQAGRFFVFTPNSYDNLATGKGLSYSVVNMALNGGLGDVEPGQKNVALLPQSQFTEKITATRHCNGLDWWILVKENNGNAFRAYPLTASGLGAPVISNVGTPVTSDAPNVISCLKFSPNGRKVVNALFHSAAFELFDFDNSTGQLSNTVTVSSSVLYGAYGVEFSPSGKLLYTTTLRPPSRIQQFDLNAGDATAILQTQTVLAEFPDEYRFGQIQRAPNGKIYVTNTFPLLFTPALGIVHAPDSAGLGCLYQPSGLNLTPGATNLGLPSFPQDFLPRNLYVTLSGPDSLCQLPGELSFQLDLSDACVVDSVRWQLSGPGAVTSQSDETITVYFTEAGTAVLVATAFSECADVRDTLVIHILENAAPELELGPDILVCENGVQVLHAGAGFYKYRWNDGSTDSTLTTLFPGTYWVDVWDACGNKQSDTITVSVLPATALDLGPDRLLCAGTSLSYPLPAPFTHWDWTPADGLDCTDCSVVHAVVDGVTTYVVVAQTGENCLSADTLTLTGTTDTLFTSLDTTVCSNETLELFGLELPADTMLNLYFTTAGGCDSVLTLTVAGIDPVQVFEVQTLCPGDTLVVNGVPFSADTVLSLAFTGSNGCDSTIQLELVLLDAPVTYLDLKACPDSFALYQGVAVQPGETRAFHWPSGVGGCDSTVIVSASAWPPPVLQWIETDTLVAGDSLHLNPAVSGVGPFVWQWSPGPPPDWLSCYDCPDPVAFPLDDVVYTVLVADANGCRAVDSIALTVLPCQPPFVPNAFTPDDDGTNDWFYVLAPECIIEVRYLRIYDRWGGLVFERTNFPANVETLGWDGQLRGKDFPMDVLVWMAEIVFPDGTALVQKGDVTLIR